RRSPFIAVRQGLWRPSAHPSLGAPASRKKPRKGRIERRKILAEYSRKGPEKASAGAHFARRRQVRIGLISNRFSGRSQSRKITPQAPRGSASRHPETPCRARSAPAPG